MVRGFFMRRGRRKGVEAEVREAADGLDLQYRARQLRHRELWGAFPVKMRPFYIAQRKACPYCPRPLALDRNDGPDAGTWDHVTPKALKGGGHETRNKIVAHRDCNQRKGHRAPYPCELLFCAITNEIVFSLERHL